MSVQMLAQIGDDGASGRALRFERGPDIVRRRGEAVGADAGVAKSISVAGGGVVGAGGDLAVHGDGHSVGHRRGGCGGDQGCDEAGGQRCAVLVQPSGDEGRAQAWEAEELERIEIKPHAAINAEDASVADARPDGGGFSAFGAVATAFTRQLTSVVAWFQPCPRLMSTMRTVYIARLQNGRI